MPSDISSYAAPANQKILPIVGAFYRPPAKTILEFLSVGAKLFLVAEPENELDVNAIAVWIKAEEIPFPSMQKLEEELPSCGFTVEDLPEKIHLGYIPKHIAAVLRPRGFEQADGEFVTDAKGSPQVKFIDPSKPMPEAA